MLSRVFAEVSVVNVAVEVELGKAVLSGYYLDRRSKDVHLRFTEVEVEELATT